MTKIFHNNEIQNILKEELPKVKQSLVIVSAFVKVDALRYIDSFLLEKVMTKKILVRFRLSDILSGSTDFELYDYCVTHNWKMYIDFNLHSKIVIFDQQTVLLGSANITLSGLGISKNPNIESVMFGDISKEECTNIESFFQQSCEVSNQLILIMKEQLLSCNNFDIISYSPEWEDINVIESCEFLWTSELLFSSSSYDVSSKDLSLLGLKRSDLGDISIVEEKFKKAKFYKWLKLSVEKELYFGELTAKLHSSIIDDPTPYRKDVKQLLSNMLNWIDELKIDEFIIDRPNYSQRIKKLKN